MEPLWTVREVAHLLALKPSTIYEWAAKGKLPCIRLGSLLRFDPGELTRWVRAQKEG
jgi:excisionase family DNA binding protein